MWEENSEEVNSRIIPSCIPIIRRRQEVKDGTEEEKADEGSDSPHSNSGKPLDPNLV